MTNSQEANEENSEESIKKKNQGILGVLYSLTLIAVTCGLLLEIGHFLKDLAEKVGSGEVLLPLSLCTTVLASAVMASYIARRSNSYDYDPQDIQNPQENRGEVEKP